MEKHRDKKQVQELMNDQKKRLSESKRKRKEKENALKDGQTKMTSFARTRGVIDKNKKRKMDEAIVRMVTCMNQPSTITHSGKHSLLRSQTM